MTRVLSPAATARWLVTFEPAEDLVDALTGPHRGIGQEHQLRCPAGAGLVRDGRLDEIVQCIRCDEKCFGNLDRGLPIECSQWE